MKVIVIQKSFLKKKKLRIFNKKVIWNNNDNNNQILILYIKIKQNNKIKTTNNLMKIFKVKIRKCILTKLLI